MRRTLKTLPTDRPPASTLVPDGTQRRARSMTRQPPQRQPADSSAVGPVVQRSGFLGRLWRRVARAPYLSREEQFRLLQVALRIKLRCEGKPEDAIVLQRPADLPAPPGTPVRQPKRDPLYARNDRDHQAPHDAPRPKAVGPGRVR
jgi:hypothetical protein